MQTREKLSNEQRDINRIFPYNVRPNCIDGDDNKSQTTHARTHQRNVSFICIKYEFFAKWILTADTMGKKYLIQKIIIKKK